MLKVFGFVRRRETLSHDEYRAAHVGYHNSHARRLNRIRGCVLNVRANRDLGELFGNSSAELLAEEPADFDGRWDGYGQLMFDSLEHYLAAKEAVLDKPGPAGLERDDPGAAVDADAHYLYAGPPVQFHVSEVVVTPVRRPEAKLFKLVQFGRRRADIASAAFQSAWSGAYAALSRNVPGLLGHIVNFPTNLDVSTGFFSKESGVFSSQAQACHRDFMSEFDGVGELWFRDAGAFLDWRKQRGGALREIEAEIFDRFFCREVDETVAVLPDRLPSASFYHR